jgi:5-hydroxyisourate hydrolase
VSRISTHILDVSRGAPAAGVRVELYRLAEGLREALAAAVTDADGRTGALLPSTDGLGGIFELVFHAGDYFRALGLHLTDPPFLDQVVIRFGVAAGAAYHVPLLLSPYGYTTYRGS